MANIGFQIFNYSQLEVVLVPQTFNMHIPHKILVHDTTFNLSQENITYPELHGMY